MSWKPNIKDVIQPIPSYTYLKKAVWKLYSKNVINQPIERMKDNHGVYAYRYGSFIVTAKKELYGNLLSVHESIVLKAMDKKIPVVIWLDSANKFYKVNPYEVQKVAKPNMKGSSVMLNFNISLCEAVNW